MYSEFILRNIADKPVQHLRVKVKLLKNDSYRKVDLAKIDYQTAFRPIYKGYRGNAVRWYPEDRFFRMQRWRCLAEGIGFVGLEEVQ